MLERRLASSCSVSQHGSCTVDVGSGRNSRVSGESLRHVIVGAVHIMVFLRKLHQLTGPRDSERAVRTLVRTLYSQFNMCCWTGIATAGRRALVAQHPRRTRLEW